jgi:hypothetical protein
MITPIWARGSLPTVMSEAFDLLHPGRVQAPCPTAGADRSHGDLANGFDLLNWLRKSC